MSGVCCVGCGDTNPDHFQPSHRHPGTRCRPCRAAYMRDYRRRNSVYREQGRRQAQAYNAALAELRVAHRDEFDGLYAVWLERLDVEQVDRVLARRGAA